MISKKFTICFTMIILFLILVVIFKIYNNKITLENFSNNKIIISGLSKKYEYNYNDFFPLKKYKYYEKNLYGPNKYDSLLKIYSKKNDCMKYASRQYGSRKGIIFKMNKNDYNPANCNIKNYKGTICTKDTKRCSFAKGHKYYTPPCCANYLTEMLFYLHDLFEKKNITYFIYWGTLLGSIRHKGLIPWDTDGDIYINENEKEKIKDLKSLIENETHYKLDLGSVIRLNYSKINTQHIDIFTYKIV